MLQPKLVRVKPLPDYKLFLLYETNEQKIFNVLPYIKGNWYGKLMDEEYFGSVHVIDDTVEWKGGQDLAPHELYELSVDYDDDGLEKVINGTLISG